MAVATDLVGVVAACPVVLSYSTAFDLGLTSQFVSVLEIVFDDNQHKTIVSKVDKER